ncbi:MAG: hypothetical protein A2992_08665 [Elusimicrobia bacterium RIFCSPLOWO2_01_FULL_59_12]|nr:MAG: hypothetical protein A2992_08665 [Elusimicrobia bacterium RIFCSPLOWO2_01_FULL_59_12]
MNTLQTYWVLLKQFPEYLPGMIAAAAVLVIAAPIYMALWYFLYRRQLEFPWRLRIAVLGVFVLFSGLAFAFASPLADRITALLNAYLFLTCLAAAYCIVALLDIFFVQHYLMRARQIYVSPPLRKIVNLGVFCLSLLPILHYVLKFNPLTLIAIPTIATAGVALAMQDTLKAFIAGVGLGQQIHVGDWIAFQDKEGHVVDINWGRTVLRTIDGDSLYIPNTLLLAQPFTNYSSPRTHRMTLKAGVYYTAPPEHVKRAMESCAPLVPGVAEHPKPAAQVLAMGESSITYALYYWVQDYGQRSEIQDQLASRVWEAFRREGFELPQQFPARPIADSGARREPRAKAKI